MKKKVLILTTKWGHVSIAQGVCDALEKSGYKTELRKLTVERLSDHSYTMFYRLFPQLWKVPFQLAEKENIGKLASKYLDKSYKKTIHSVILKSKPDFVINTYFAFNPSLETLTKELGFKAINIVANPRTFSKLEVSKQIPNFVFDKKAKKDCLSLGIPKSLAIESGWFVRKEYQTNYDVEKVRKRLSLQKDVFTACIVGGSEGVYSMLKILPAFLHSPAPVQVVFVCGNNKQLLATVKVFRELAEKQNKHSVKIIPMGFTDELHYFLKAADLVVGKAGPNLMFETVATLTPFFAVTHIAGQEDGNLDIIRKYKLGFVEENPVKAVKNLRHIIKNPKVLKRFTKTIARMALFNLQAKENLTRQLEI